MCWLVFVIIGNGATYQGRLPMSVKRRFQQFCCCRHVGSGSAHPGGQRRGGGGGGGGGAGEKWAGRKLALMRYVVSYLLAPCPCGPVAIPLSLPPPPLSPSPSNHRSVIRIFIAMYVEKGCVRACARARVCV